MNSVHAYHGPAAFIDLKHWVFSFHDTTFECIASNFRIALAKGTRWSVLEDLANED